jgi:hypothetical protein
MFIENDLGPACYMLTVSCREDAVIRRSEDQVAVYVHVYIPRGGCQAGTPVYSRQAWCSDVSHRRPLSPPGDPAPRGSLWVVTDNCPCSFYDLTMSLLSDHILLLYSDVPLECFVLDYILSIYYLSHHTSCMSRVGCKGSPVSVLPASLHTHTSNVLVLSRSSYNWQITIAVSGPPLRSTLVISSQCGCRARWAHVYCRAMQV